MNKIKFMSCLFFVLSFILLFSFNINAETNVDDSSVQVNESIGNSEDQESEEIIDQSDESLGNSELIFENTSNISRNKRANRK